MKAIAIIPQTKNIQEIDIDTPSINNPDEIKIKILQVGICGTDREEVSGGRATAPRGESNLVIGHEMFGEVVEVGKSVSKAKAGDYAVFTVRRGCKECSACLNNRSDMCYTGNYTERGIKGADGYQTEYAVDKEQYVIKVPDDIKDIGVLTEPMSVAAKAIDEAILVQSARMKDFEDVDKWLNGKRALITGLGPIGLLAAFALRLKGAEVVGLDIVNEQSIRPQILEKIGGKYLNGKEINTLNVDDSLGQIDFIFDATGVAKLEFEIIDALGINGIYVITGIPHGDHPITISGAELMQQLVLKNQIVLGSVNAAPYHYEQAVNYLSESKKRWPEEIKNVITHRFSPADYQHAFEKVSVNEIKAIIDWEHK